MIFEKRTEIMSVRNPLGYISPYKSFLPILSGVIFTQGAKYPTETNSCLLQYS